MKELLSSLSFNQANSVARLSALCICQNAFTGKTLLAKAYHAPIKAPDRNRRKSKLGELSWTARSVLSNRKEIRISPPGQACQNRTVTAGKTIRLNEFSPVTLNKPGRRSIPPNPVIETGCDIIIKPVRAKITGWITPYAPPGDSSSDREQTTLTFQLMRTKLPWPKCRCRLMYLSHKPIYLTFWISNLISDT